MHIPPDDLTGACINAVLRIHRKFRSGMLESAYETLLFRMLVREGFDVERQKAISFEFEGDRYENAFRADLIVNGRLIIEVKAQESNSSVHTKQLLTYLRLAKLPLGLVINFGLPKLMDGVKRVVNDLPPAYSPQLRVNQPSERLVHPCAGLTPRC
ncbi:GxxExxY protein [Gemmatimonas sp.]|jgi:iron complex transport system substrate-binding protein|uniref:GxxExxY protein n=1 Tax=Gemmatimonas sp. TaxID=1962908 RepID=UPI0037BE3F2E